MTPTVVCFKWKTRGYRSIFTGQQVRTLRDSVFRNYRTPHRFLCITDDSSDCEGVETFPIWDDYAEVRSPHGGGNPSCYRRLKLFDPTIRDLLRTERIIALDLDTVVTGNLSPLFDRGEDFMIWGETNPKSWYNGSMFMLTAGARPKVWTEFHPRRSPKEAFQAGKFGSDQGWISHCLGYGEPTWTREDGVFSYRVHLADDPTNLPRHARIVMFHGKLDPWHQDAQKLPWVREHYREGA